MKGIKIKADISKCIGCGSCVSIAPEVFELSPEFKVQVKKEYKDKVITDPKIIKKIKSAVEMCPTGTIKIEEVK